jgi:hypothetical protein
MGRFAGGWGNGIVKTSRRWRGFAALLGTAVESGSLAIERVQMQTAERWFGVLEQIPSIRAAAQGVHSVHIVCVSSTHGIIRAVARLVVTSALEVIGDARVVGEGQASAPGHAQSTGETKRRQSSRA